MSDKSASKSDDDGGGASGGEIMNEVSHSKESQHTPEASVTWECFQCTFVNTNESDQCQACDSPRNILELLRFELDQCNSLINELKQMISTQGVVIKCPDSWTGGMDSSGVNRVKLTADHPEYKYVLERGGASLQALIKNIVSIHRIENWAIYQVYAQKKEAMLQKNGIKVHNEQWLWHGSDSKALDSICTYGFNRSYCGRHGTLIGCGVYFATDINTSLTFSTKYIEPVSTLAAIFLRAYPTYKVLLCRVLTGQYTVGSSEMIEAPLMKKGGDRCDSVTDSLAAPSMFVVFKDYQAYPEYEITFRQ